MTADHIELKPCPFCGKEALDQWPCEWLDGSGANVIRCAWCHGAAPAKVWNRRALAAEAGAGEPVVWVNPDDLDNPNFVGINAAKAGHESLGKHYTRPLYAAAPRASVTDAECDAIYQALNDWARDVDSYDFGLPMYSGGGAEAARDVIRKALEAAATSRAAARNEEGK